MAEKTEAEKAIYTRFWEKVDQTDIDGCWPWLGGVNFQGYGVAYQGTRRLPAHRLAWLLAHPGQELPAGRPVYHICPSGPNKLCCNPNHLADQEPEGWTQTLAELGRGRRLDGTSQRMFTDEQVREIRGLHAEQGYGIMRLSRTYGVSTQTIRAILDRRTYRDVADQPEEE